MPDEASPKFQNVRSAYDLAKSAVGDRIERSREERGGSGLGRTVAGLRSLAKSGTYRRLHDDLTTVISRVRLTVSALDSATLETLDSKYAQAYATAAEEGSEDGMRVAREQLDALAAIKELLEGQGDDLAERVLERDALTGEEAGELLSYLKDITKRVEVLGDDARVDTAGAFESFLEAVSDERISGRHRADLIKSVAGAVAGSDLFRGGAAAAELTRIAAEADDLSGEEGGRAVRALEAMRDKLDVAEKIHYFAVQAQEGGMGREELAETLDSLRTTMSRIDGFADEQRELSALMREGALDDKDREEDLRAILAKVADRTVESKTLFTLDRLDEKFDAAVLDTEELAEALEKGGLAKELIENAAEVTGGGGGGVADTLKDLAQFALFNAGDFLPWWLQVGGAAALESGAVGSAVGGLGTAALGTAGGWWAGRRGGGGAAPAAPGGPDAKAAKAGGRGWWRSSINALRGMGGRGRLAAAILGGGAAAGAAGLAMGDDEGGDGAVPVKVVGDAPLEGVEAIVGRASVQDETAGDRSVLENAALGGVATAATYQVGRMMLRRPAPAADPDAPKPRLRVGPDGKLDPSALRGAPAPAVPKAPGPGTKALDLAKSAGRRVPILSTAIGAADYAMAESDEERAASVGGTLGAGAATLAGAKLGALIGSVVPVGGTLIGAGLGAAAGIGGYYLGSMASGLFTDAEDSIPDAVREAGPAAEIAYINDMLGDPSLDEGDRESLVDRRASLMSAAVAAQAAPVVEAVPVTPYANAAGAEPASAEMDAMMISLAPAGLAQAAPAAPVQAPAGRTGRVKARTTIKRPGAQAPSTSGDDYGVALANSLLFA